MALARISSWNTIRFGLAKLNISSDNALSLKCIKYKPILSTITPSVTCISGNKTITEELGLPLPPKRPTPPFLIFVSKEKDKYPNKNASDLASIISQDWAKLDQATKAKYSETFQTGLEEYKKQYSNYMESLSDDQIQEVKDLRQKRNLKKKLATERKKIRKESKQCGKPKYPGNGYSLFFEKFVCDNEVNKENLMKSVGDEWQKLPEKEKDIFKVEAKKRMAKYKKELYKWELEMESTGRSYLVRHLVVETPSPKE